MADFEHDWRVAVDRDGWRLTTTQCTACVEQGRRDALVAGKMVAYKSDDGRVLCYAHIVGLLPGQIA